MPFEFPNGYRQDYGSERFRIAEALIDPSKVRTNISQNALGVSHAVTTSVGKQYFCDFFVIFHCPFKKITEQNLRLKYNEWVYRHVRH